MTSLASYAFPADAQNWALGGGSWDGVNGHTAAGCLSFTTDGTANAGVRSPAVAPTASLQLYVTAWTKVANPAPLVIAVNEYSNTSGTLLLRTTISDPVAGTGAWQELDFNLTLGADCVRFRVLVEIGDTTNGATFLVDDVAFDDAAPFAPGDGPLSVHEVMSGGFVRDRSDGASLVVTTNTVDARMVAGFLRDPYGRLVVVSI